MPRDTSDPKFVNRINWDTITRADFDLVVKIVERAERELEFPWDGTRSQRLMDIQACHISCPLQLEAMLTMPAVDFAHDFHGICRHINRETGRLEDCFSPRCAQR